MGGAAPAAPSPPPPWSSPWGPAAPSPSLRDPRPLAPSPPPRSLSGPRRTLGPRRPFSVPPGPPPSGPAATLGPARRAHLGADLVAALARLDVHDLAHGAGSLLLARVGDSVVSPPPPPSIRLQAGLSCPSHQLRLGGPVPYQRADSCAGLV